MTQIRPSLHAEPDTLAVDRARLELRAGRPVRVCGATETRVAITIDTLRPSVLEALASTPGADLRVATTRERAAALGLAPDADIGVHVPSDVAFADLRAFAGAESAAAVLVGGVAPERATDVECAALDLAKHALLLPAVLTVRDDPVLHAHLLSAEARAIAGYADAGTLDLERVAEARVPLADAPQCRFLVFRNRRDGVEHVAVLVGAVDAADVTDVRVHSACLTGDLLGSLRCDCGDQLRGAVRRFAALGAGVLLYVGQEGRGIGLANKLRAYRLQEDGLDTIDADRHLGFAGDERRYEIAAALLQKLGIVRVRLHTNNPRKAGELAGLGVDVVEYRTLAGAVNPHNERYIRVRRERAGHFAPDGQ